MMSKDSPLKTSYEVLASVPSLVLVTYMLGLFYDTSFIQDLGWSALLLFIFLKIILYSGIYGVLVELASGQEFLIDFKQFRQNIRAFWKIYSLLLVVPFFIHFPLTLLSNYFKALPVTVVFTHFNIIALYILANYIIEKKYVKQLGLPRRKIPLSIFNIVVILALYFIDLGVFYLPQFVMTEKYYLPNFLGFLSEIIHYFQFLYFSVLILNSYPEIQKHFTPQRELFLINPWCAGMLRSLGYALFSRGYPPAFVVLKAMTPKNYKVREFNQVIWRNRYYRGHPLVAITSYTMSSFEAYKIAKGYKQRGATVVMGGPHVTYLPKEALEYCDSVVVGEAEGVWKDVIKDYENHTLKKEYTGSGTKEYHDQVYQELLNSSPDVIKDFLETTRGCKFKCHFCTIPGLSGGNVRNKPVFQLVELIRKVKKKYNQVTFIDNNIYNDPAYARELFKALKPLNIKWRTACTIDIAKNEETLKLAKESGCVGLLVGYEISGNSPDSQNLRGKFSMAEQYRRYTQTIQQLGIAIRANFIFGFESDRLKDIWRLWRYCLSLGANSAGLGILTPLPGSQLYHDMLIENRLTNLNWCRYSMFQLVFKHKYLNDAVVSKVFPVVSVFYLLTTSKTGRILFSLLIILALCTVLFKL